MLVEQENNLNYSPRAHGLQILRVFYQRPKWFIMPLNQRDFCGLLLLYNNLEDKQFFHEFTGTINHR